MKNDKQFWDSLSKRYNNMFNTYRPYIPMYKFIKQSLNKDMHVLEVGTGTGLVAREIAEQIKSIEATDYSEEMIATAKGIAHTPNINFSCADIFDLPFNDNRFDAVIVSNVLHIIPKPERALQEIKRVLKPEGLLIASTFLWKELSLLGRLQKFVMLKKDFPIQSYWNEQEYKYFISQNGFEVTKFKKIKASFAIGCVLAEVKK